MDRRIIELYDEYAHAPLPRRVFLDRLAALVGGSAAAALLLPLLEADRAAAAMVAPDDPRIVAARVTYSGKSAEVAGYLARPTALGHAGGVVVIHENRGLNAHIEDVARRLALAGYLALAPDLLSALGGTPSDEDKARELIGKLDPDVSTGDAMAGVDWLHRHENGNGKAGAVGFCWGGGVVGQVAVNDPTLDAAVVYYGLPPAADDVAKITAPLLLNYAGLDQRLDALLPAYRAALDKAGVTYTLYVYDGADHAFNNDTSPQRYNEAAAKLAWDRTLAFLGQNLTS